MEVQLETDHKPLVPIFTFKSYVPGRDLLAAEALSRAPLENTSSTSELEEGTDAFVRIVVSSFPASEARLEGIKLG